MLARRKNKEAIDIIQDTSPLIKVSEFFLKDESKKYILVVDSDCKPKGIIYKEDVKNAGNVSCLMDYVTKRLVTVDEKKTAAEIEEILFALIKENIKEIVITDKEGIVKGVWEKNESDFSDFHEKFIFIKQAGYSITDWISYYYGQNAVIGIHSFTQYTEIFLNEITNSEIKVKFICQSGGNMRGFRGEILEKSFADISAEDLNDCDLVINTFMSLKDQVQYLYRKHKNYNNVISMYDIVNELYHYEQDAGYMLRVANMIARTGRKVFIFNYPNLANQKNRSDREELILRKALTWPRILDMVRSSEEGIRQEAEKIIMPAMNKARKKEGHTLVTFDDVRNYFPVMSESSNAHVRYIGSSATIYDMESPYVHIKNGMRVTLNSVANNVGEQCTKIHLFGKSWVFGHHCSDEFTIPSVVQKISNGKKLNFHVYNHAVPGIREDIIANLMYEQNDKWTQDEIFVLVHMFKDYGNQFNEKVATESGYVNVLSSDRPHEYGEIWVDSGHIGEDGSELLAQQIVDGLLGNAKAVPGQFRNKFNPNAGRPIFKYEVKDQASLWADMPEFREYQKYIAEHRQRVGAIVMNCNPFTLGHRYLIETASSQCDKLYIFVVEEDKSVFPFEDRLKLVMEGVKDLDNVTVLHSGNFIISALTFPGYFNKSVDNNVSVDTSDDLTLFAKYIAPTLGINIRFAGEEPIDYITRQYNETMEELLPKHGIEFIEIPRKTMGDSVISASRVRKLLLEDNFDEIAEIVPETTLEYLKKNKEMILRKL